MEIFKKKSLFWDVGSLDAENDSDFIIGRILDFGDIEDFKWAIKKYGFDKIKDRFLKCNFSTRKSFVFWRDYFNIDESKCTKRLKTKQSAFWKK
jgi:hypothetical protein